MKKIKNARLLIDGDILAYRASSATDGRVYKIRYEKSGVCLVWDEKYKKDADRKIKELEEEGYIVSCTCEYEPEPLSHALKIIDDSIVSLETLLSPHVESIAEKHFYLSMHGSFREALFPPYKSNRVDMRRPKHLEDCKRYLIDKYNAQCMPGQYEADDLMAMNQAEDTVICSVDKDLMQVPGHHFNWVRNEYSVVSEEEGYRSFYHQLLVGDSTDGIVGLPGVGPVTAKKLLKGAKSKYLMYCIVLKEYIKRFPIKPGEDSEEYYRGILTIIKVNAMLLYLLRSPNDVWNPPEEEHEDTSGMSAEKEGVAG